MRNAALADALAAVPRALFVPAQRRGEAYVDAPVRWRGESCASQPTVVAAMLEQLDLRPGHRVLEVGAATGFNAAVMARLVGPGGHVTAVELDAEMAAVARANLAALGVANVEVATGDAAAWFAGDARYDRVIWTCAAWALPPHPPWWLANGGRVVAPVILRGNVQKSVAFAMDADGRLRSDGASSVQFVVQRGAADRTADRARPLAGGWTLWRDDVDAAQVAPEIWTGPVGVTALEGIASTGWELLVEAATWLAVTDARTCSVLGPPDAAPPAAVTRTGATLPRGTGVGLADDGALALLALTAAAADSDDPARPRPVVVLGFGAAEQLVADLVAAVRRWAALPDRAVTARLEVDVDAAGRIAGRLPGR